MAETAVHGSRHAPTLAAPRSGVPISAEHQLSPEQSTSALVVHHPSAEYFTI
jgi:5-methyltetrahydrofolate--homocysteine methyltransferase